MTTDFTDFLDQKEVEVSTLPSIRQFKKGDVFIGFLNSVTDSPLSEEADNGMGGLTWGKKVFVFMPIGDKNIDHRSEDGTSAGEAIKNKIPAGVEHKFFTNYTGKGFLNVNGAKLSEVPLGAIVKIENMGRKKSEKSSFSYKLQSIIAKKDNKGEYLIHPDYKALDDFPSKNSQPGFDSEEIPF